MKSMSLPYTARCWCPDRTVAQARKYVSDSQGDRYTEGVILDLEKTWEESDVNAPLACLLSMGSDPTNQIEHLAKKLRVGKISSELFRFQGVVNVFCRGVRVQSDINGSGSRSSCQEVAPTVHGFGSCTNGLPMNARINQTFVP